MSRLQLGVLLVVVAGLLGTCAGSAAAAGWGSIKGRFVYDGQAPAPVPIVQAVCGPALVVEDLVIEPKTKGIANVVVWARNPAAVNPALLNKAAANVVLDNIACHFVPHVVGVTVGQTLVVKNSDPVAHSTKIDGQNLQINPVIPAAGVFNQPITQPEGLPAIVSCSLHTWMGGRLVVRPDPYFAISNAAGNFEIDDLPVGNLEFQIWHEHVGYVTSGSVNGQKVAWPKGRPTWAIQAGMTTNLGDLKITP